MKDLTDKEKEYHDVFSKMEILTQRSVKLNEEITQSLKEDYMPMRVKIALYEFAKQLEFWIHKECDTLRSKIMDADEKGDEKHHQYYLGQHNGTYNVLNWIKDLYAETTK